jgi:hypothetical protein
VKVVEAVLVNRFTPEKLLASDSKVVEAAPIVMEPPKETAEPLIVIWELTKLPFVMMPVPVRELKEAAPESESDVP